MLLAWCFFVPAEARRSHPAVSAGRQRNLAYRGNTALETEFCDLRWAANLTGTSSPACAAGGGFSRAHGSVVEPPFVCRGIGRTCQATPAPLFPWLIDAPNFAAMRERKEPRMKKIIGMISAALLLAAPAYAAQGGSSGSGSSDKSSSSSSGSSDKSPSSSGGSSSSGSMGSSSSDKSSSSKSSTGGSGSSGSSEKSSSSKSSTGGAGMSGSSESQSAEVSGKVLKTSGNTVYVRDR